MVARTVPHFVQAAQQGRAPAAKTDRMVPRYRGKRDRPPRFKPLLCILGFCDVEHRYYEEGGGSMSGIRVLREHCKRCHRVGGYLPTTTEARIVAECNDDERAVIWR